MKLNPPLSVAGLCFFLMMGISWQVGAYDEDDLEKLKATGDCSGCDLSEVFLQGADLTGGNLTKARLDNANLTGTIFCGTKMPDESFNDSGC